jgi:hypothetical protein
MRKLLLLLQLLIGTSVCASPQTGPLDMQGFQIKRLAPATTPSDAVRLDQILATPTPANTPVPTATAVNTPVPTATAVPTLTPVPTGIVAHTGSNVFAGRVITGTTNEIAVTNGDGVSGSPVLALSPILTWVPTLSASAGTFTSTTIYYASYVRRGNWICATVGFQGTTSTNADSINFTLPIATASLGIGQIVGAAVSIDGGSTKGGFISMSNNSTAAACFRYDAAQFTAGASRYCLSSFCYFGQ